MIRLKNSVAIVLSIALAALFIGNLKTERAYASNTIYITPGGGIVPDTANITTADNVTYTFTGNVNDSIVVQRSNIVIDGAGFLLNGTGTGTGISLTYGINVTLTNVTIERFDTGILLDTCTLCEVMANTITGNDWHAIDLDSSSNNTVSGNSIAGNANRAIMLYYSSNNTIIGNTISGNYKGIEIESFSRRNLVSGNHIWDQTHEGVIVEYSEYNNITDNNITRNSGTGITITQSGNTAIEDNWLAENQGIGLIVTQSLDCTIIGNRVTGNQLGINMRYANGTLMRNNTMTNNTWNFELDFFSVSDFDNDVDTSNTIEGRPIYYWTHRQSETVPADAGMVILYDCTNVTAQNLNITDRVRQGIVIACSTNATVTDCSVNSDEYCIYLWNVSSCKINSSYLDGFTGIQLDYSTDNIVYNNTLINSGNFGAINIMQSSGNVFFHNNFTNNYGDVLITDESANDWDNGYPDGGNYWNRYVERILGEADEYSGPSQNEIGSDGFWDKPYPLNENNTDRYPIVPEYTTTLITVAFTATTMLAVIVARRKNKA